MDSVSRRKTWSSIIGKPSIVLTRMKRRSSLSELALGTPEEKIVDESKYPFEEFVCRLLLLPIIKPRIGKKLS